MDELLYINTSDYSILKYKNKKICYESNCTQYLDFSNYIQRHAKISLIKTKITTSSTVYDLVVRI